MTVSPVTAPLSSSWASRGAPAESNDCQPPDCPTAELTLTKWPHGWGDVSLWTQPDPPIVSYEGGVTLYWSGPSGATYTIDYYTPQSGPVHAPQPGEQPFGDQGSYPAADAPPLELTQNTTFYLSVAETIDNQTYHSRQQVNVTVEAPRPEIVSFTIAADAVAPGSPLSFTLSWQLKNVASFQIIANDGPNHQPRTLPVPANQNTYQVVPTQLETVYTLSVLPGRNAMTQQASPSARVTAVINQMAPVGAVLAYCGSDASKLSPGWLLCDGAAFDQAEYPDLYKFLGNRNKAPDLRGYFLRGLDSSGKVDPDNGRAIGSLQEDALQDHVHGYQYVPESGEGYSSGSHRRIEWNTGTSTTGAQNARTASETRPKNAAVFYIIFAGLPKS